MANKEKSKGAKPAERQEGIKDTTVQSDPGATTRPTTDNSVPEDEDEDDGENEE